MSADKVHLQRLRWQCRRGLLELDLIFEAFLSNENGYRELSAVQKESFQNLLLNSDQDLQEWMMGKTEPKEPRSIELIKLIKEAV